MYVFNVAHYLKYSNPTIESNPTIRILQSKIKDTMKIYDQMGELYLKYMKNENALHNAHVLLYN